MKIGILTLHSQLNYGGVLQAYALQKVLRNNVVNAEIIDYWSSRDNADLYGGLLCSKLLPTTRLYRFFKNILKNGFAFADLVRRKRTVSFLKNKISLSQVSYKDARELRGVSGYDCYIVGSDQIWNPNWHGIPNPFLLSFLDCQQKKISYAASFGVNEVPLERQQEYSSALREFASIGVREKAGVEIVKELTGRDSDWVLDPTLLLSREDWSELCGPESGSSPYIFCYWLGDVSTVIKLLVDLSKKKSMKIKLYGNPDILMSSYGKIFSLFVRIFFSFHPRVKCCFDAGPVEFLRGLRDCAGVVSDSFHALIFSVIFSKPAKIFVNSSVHRKGTSSRLLDFARYFGLEKVVEVDIPDGGIVLEDPDYEQVAHKIEDSQKTSLTFLFDSL